MRRRDRLILRSLDLAAGLLLAPLFATTLIVAGAGRLASPRLRRARLLVSSRRIGTGGRPFPLRRYGRGTPRLLRTFLLRARLRRLPVAWNLLAGDVALVGDRPPRPGSIIPTLRPGLIQRSDATRRTGTEFLVDAEHEQAPLPGWRADLGVFARWLLLAWLPRTRSSDLARVDILDVAVDNVSLDEAVARVCAALRGARPTLSTFVNAHCLNVAARDPEYRAVLAGAGHVFPDGFGVQLAGRILGRPLRQNVNGTDLFPALCRALEGSNARLYLLGGRPGVADEVRRWIGEHHPGLTVCGARHGHFDESESALVARAIRDANTDLLLVARGVPLQETWLAEHLGRTGARVGIGVGGLFDFYSGRIPRAPRWMREVGLEWAYRLLQEPRRLARRYLVGNFVFLSSIWQQRRREAQA
jgi:N-acetylglucosaminyldiphosphoundecaprenol N-acetyl-beta-D-mannosaminyltransferase